MPKESKKIAHKNEKVGKFFIHKKKMNCVQGKTVSFAT